ncbi:MAG: hypothetical protein KC418_08470 [Anaerolineales bacterium]|nr:hypothetical protein [Anaerolineales bacterium]MCB8950477.1 hypothetical protein [Ardenticatenales bacterium]
MCTMIVKQVEMDGSGKGAKGWFTLRQANVSYDHPFNAPLEHALNIDFVNESLGPGARVAVELTEQAARTLAATILEILAQAEAEGQLV